MQLLFVLLHLSLIIIIPHCVRRFTKLVASDPNL